MNKSLQKTVDVPNLIADGVTREMIDKTNAKFERMDHMLANEYYDGTEEQQNEFYSSLVDPTLYAYCFFKDPRNSKKRFKARPYQDMMLNDPHRFIQFVASNQIGKSISLNIKALVFSLQNPGTTTVIWSKTLPQAKDQLRMIKLFLSNSTLDYQYDIGESDNKQEIYFKHFDEIEEIDKATKEKKIVKKELPQSRILCVPATEGSLGFPVDLALLDELAFYDDGEYFYEQIALPRTYATKGQVITFSNPNGQQGIFWKLWQSTLFHKYRFNFFDNPDNTQAEFDMISKDLSQERIDSTLLAIFTSPEGAFLSIEERKSLFENKQNEIPLFLSQPLYVSFDFAKSQDQTVRCIGSPVIENNDIVGVNVHEVKVYPLGTGYDEIIDDLILLVEEVGSDKFATISWDDTGVGKGIADFITKIKKYGISCDPKQFSLQNKSAMYTTFKFLAEQNLKGKNAFKMPYSEEANKQFAQLRFKRSSGRGYLQVHHEKESQRDDIPDSVVTLVSSIINPDAIPVSVNVVGSSATVINDIFRCECGNCVDHYEDKCTFCGKEINL